MIGRRRPRTPGDKGWTPVPHRTFTDRLLDALRLGVALGIENYLDGHPDVLAHFYERTNS